MEKKKTLSKILTVAGTVLVWLPLLAPFIFGFVSLSMDGIYRYDFLMPAELGIMVFVGGALLLWAANRTLLRRKIIGWGLAAAAVSMAVLFALGDVETTGWEFVVAIGLLVTYSLGILVMGIGGVLLWRELFNKPTE